MTEPVQVPVTRYRCLICDQTYAILGWPARTQVDAVIADHLAEHATTGDDGHD